MSREAVATALDEAAEALARAAHALRGTEQPAAGVDVQDRVPSRPAAAEAGVPPAPASAPTTGHGACPKHHRDYKDMGYGPKCTAKDDDPAWSNQRGYCTITPKNEAQWLKVHTAPSDIPF